MSLYLNLLRLFRSSSSVDPDSADLPPLQSNDQLLKKSHSLHLSTSGPSNPPNRHPTPTESSSYSDDLSIPDFPRSVSAALAINKYDSIPTLDRQRDAEMLDRIMQSSDPVDSDDDIKSPSAPACSVIVDPLCFRDCTICGETIAIYAPEHDSLTANIREYYDCGASDYGHLKCAMCFGEWITAASRSYFDGTFPIECPEGRIEWKQQENRRKTDNNKEKKDDGEESDDELCCPSGCEVLIPDSEIRRLLNFERNRHIQPVYEKACILAGLMDLSAGNQTEDGAAAQPKESKSLRPIKGKGRKARMVKQPQTQEKENLVPVVCAKCGEYTALFPANYKEKAATLKTLMIREAEEEHRRLTVEAERLKVLGLGRGNPGDGILGILEEMINPPDYWGDEAEQKEPPKSSPALVRQSSDPNCLTSLFFDCERPECSGSTCLRCGRAVEYDLKALHECDSSMIEKLYQELLGVLASASTRKCPECGKSGLKDEACTNISCDDPSHGLVTWCYCCQRSTVNNPDYWSHQGFTFDADDDKCMAYLNYRYYPESGRIEPAGIFPYHSSAASQASLRRFHMILQKKRVQEWKEEYANQPHKLALIAEMIQKKCPAGLFDPDDEAGIERAELVRYAWKMGSTTMEKQINAESVQRWVNQASNTQLLAELAKLEEQEGKRTKRQEFTQRAMQEFGESIRQAKEAEAKRQEEIRIRREEERVRREQQRALTREQREQQRREQEPELWAARQEMQRRREERAETLRWIREQEEQLQNQQQREERERLQREQEERERQARIERERREREERARQIEEISRRQDEEFRRLRETALRRKNQTAPSGSNAADRRRQRREMERMQLMAMRNEQIERMLASAEEEKEREREREEKKSN